MTSLSVVIPARLDSTRVPRKALQLIEGLPIVEHVRRRAVEAEVGPVFVATDSPEIAAAIRSFGGQVIETGPELNGTRRVARAALSIRAEVLLNIQGDQPRLDPEHVRLLAAAMDGAQIATLASPLSGCDRGDPSRVKVRVERGWAVDFSRSWREGMGHLHLGLYGFTREALLRVTSGPISARARAEGLEQLTWLERGSAIRVVTVGASAPAVDTWAQLSALRATSGG